MKTAIVYFSRNGQNWVDGTVRSLEKGNTEILAQYLKEITGGDRIPLVMKEPYSSDYETCARQAQNDQLTRTKRELLPLPDFSSYEVIYLGYPIYWEDLPSPVVTFLSDTDLSGKTIYPFSTHEGSGLGATVSHIRELAKGAYVLDPLPIPGSLVHKAGNRMKNWTEKHTF